MFEIAAPLGFTSIVVTSTAVDFRPCLPVRIWFCSRHSRRP